MDEIGEIFALAGWVPHSSGRTEPDVRRVELRIGRRLPSAFRSLLLFDNGVELLREHSNCDQPIPCPELGSPTQRWDNYDPLGAGLLPFMFENEGVCTWAISLEDADDPRVFVEIESGSPPRWQLVAPAFTRWLRCQVADKQVLDSSVFAAQAPELDDAGLDLLRRTFREGDSTFAWPGTTNYRFSNERSRLLLWSNPGQCDWWIGPARGASIGDALDALPDVPGLSEALYAIRNEQNEAVATWKRTRAPKAGREG